MSRFHGERARESDSVVPQPSVTLCNCAACRQHREWRRDLGSVRGILRWVNREQEQPATTHDCE